MQSGHACSDIWKIGMVSTLAGVLDSGKYISLNPDGMLKLKLEPSVSLDA